MRYITSRLMLLLPIAGLLSIVLPASQAQADFDSIQEASFSRQNDLTSKRLTDRLFILADGGGDSGGGGGVGFACSENGKDHVYLADTYSLLHSSRLNKKFADTAPDAVIAAAARYFEERYPQKLYSHPFQRNTKVSLAWMLISRRAQLDFNTYIQDPLPLMRDDHISPNEIPRGCKKVQLAIQDVTRREVYGEYGLCRNLSHLEQGLFELHETLISLRDQPGADTTPIRAMVSQFTSRIDFQALTEKIMSLSDKNPNTLWDQIRESPYCALNSEKGIIGNFLCDFARHQEIANWKMNRQKSKLPTLLQLPRSMQCQVVAQTYSGTSPLGSRFNLQRTSGSGRPKDKDNQYSLLYSSQQGARSLRSGFFDFQTSSHQRQVMLSNHGGVHSSMRFTDGKQEVDLWINQYVDISREFIGNFSLPSALPEENFKISCWPGDEVMKFAIDIQAED